MHSQFNLIQRRLVQQKVMEGTVFSTLVKLQQLKKLPKAQPIRLNTSDLYLGGCQANKKYLVITDNNIIGYLQFCPSGKPDDKDGVIIFTNGAYYIGNVVKGKMSGMGKLINEAEMYSYDGEWSNCQPNGQGEQNISGNIYKGNFKDGKKDGKGQLIYADSSVFSGNFKSNQISGFGKHQTSQSEWKGFWHSGYLEGQGTQIILTKNNSKSSTYLGWFVRGERQGFGKFTWDRNREYEGNFQRGQLHGEGVLRLLGHTYRGIWEQGTDLQIKEVHVSPSIIQFKRVEKDYKIQE